MKKSRKTLSSFQLKLKRAFLFSNWKISLGTFQTAILAFQKVLYSWNIYTSLYDITLGEYRDLVCFDVSNKDKSRSIRKIKFLYTPKSMILAVQERFSLEYIELSENKELMSKMEAQNRLEAVRDKIIITGLGVEYLKAKILISKSEKVDYEKIFAYFKAKRVRFKDEHDLLKRLVADYKALCIEYDTIYKSKKQEEHDDDNKFTRKSLSTIITRLKKAGYSVDYKMKMNDYIAALNGYRQEVEYANEQIEKMKSR